MGDRRDPPPPSLAVSKSINIEEFKSLESRIQTDWDGLGRLDKIKTGELEGVLCDKRMPDKLKR